MIAKMDATENDVPSGLGFQIQGFPTIKLFKANDNAVIDYSGDRTLDSFVEFLKENTVNTVSVSSESAEEEGDEEDHAHDEL
jgi:protein disulfide-isomerase A1